MYEPTEFNEQTGMMMCAGIFSMFLMLIAAHYEMKVLEILLGITTLTCAILT